MMTVFRITARNWVNPIVLLALVFVVSTTARAEQSGGTSPLSDSLGWLNGSWQISDSVETADDNGTKMSFRWAADKEVLLWEGSYASDEATWSFVATVFYDPKKDRLRMFSFNGQGQRHLGVLTHAGPGRLVWKMSGLRSDGQIESFVMEFLHGQTDTLVFSMAERIAGDADGSSNTSITLKRSSEPNPKGRS